MTITESDTVVVDIPVEHLHPADDNPRGDLGDLEGLTASIRAAGILEPLIVVERIVGGGFTIVAGHRRHAAAHLAQVDTVPCIVRELTTEERMETMAIENLQRADLTPLDEARVFQWLVDLGQTQHAIAERVGCSQSHVSRRLALNELGNDDREQLAAGKLTVRQAEDRAAGKTPAPPVAKKPAGKITPKLVDKVIKEAKRDRELVERMRAKLAEARDEIERLTAAQPVDAIGIGAGREVYLVEIREPKRGDRYWIEGGVRTARGDGTVTDEEDTHPVILRDYSMPPVESDVTAEVVDLFGEPEGDAPVNLVGQMPPDTADDFYDPANDPQAQWELANIELINAKPWPQYGASDERNLARRCTMLHSVEKCRHVIAWETRQLGRQSIIDAARARIEELEGRS